MTRLAEAAELARLFARCPDLLGLCGEDGRLTEVNPAWQAALGRAPEEHKRRPWLSFVHPQDRAKTRQALARLRAGAPSVRVDNRWRRGDGRYVRLAWSLAPSPVGRFPTDSEAALPRPRGSVAGRWLMLGREEGESQLEERRLKEELVQAEKLASVGLLLGGIAHELSNPLTTILGHVQLLLMENPASAQLQRDLSLILRETGRCTRLIKSLLTFARKHDAARLPSELNQLAAEMLELKGYDLRRNGIAVVRDFAADLPPVLVDPHQVQQVLLNLLNNAEHAMEGARGTLRVETFAEGGEVVLAVADSGPGIPPDVLPRLFEPFFTTKPAGKGTGLGLSICERIAREHGGRVEVQSPPGKGARFLVRLPASRRPHPEPAKAGGARVLVLDDDRDVLRFMSRALSQSGRRVDAFWDPARALTALAAAPYDAVICDFHMPAMDGETFRRKALAARPELKDRFILLTGQVNLASARRFGDQEGVAVLVKPFELKEFERVLQRAAADCPRPR